MCRVARRGVAQRGASAGPIVHSAAIVGKNVESILGQEFKIAGWNVESRQLWVSQIDRKLKNPSQ